MPVRKQGGKLSLLLVETKRYPSQNSSIPGVKSGIGEVGGATRHGSLGQLSSGLSVARLFNLSLFLSLFLLLCRLATSRWHRTTFVSSSTCVCEFQTHRRVICERAWPAIATGTQRLRRIREFLVVIVGFSRFGARVAHYSATLNHAS